MVIEYDMADAALEEQTIAAMISARRRLVFMWLHRCRSLLSDRYGDIGPCDGCYRDSIGPRLILIELEESGRVLPGGD